MKIKDCIWIFELSVVAYCSLFVCLGKSIVSCVTWFIICNKFMSDPSGVIAGLHASVLSEDGVIYIRASVLSSRAWPGTSYLTNNQPVGWGDGSSLPWQKEGRYDRMKTHILFQMTNAIANKKVICNALLYWYTYCYAGLLQITNKIWKLYV